MTILLVSEVNATYAATGDVGGNIKFWNTNSFTFISSIGYTI